MMKKILLAIIFGLFLSISFAQIPAGYYDSADGLSGEALKSELHNIIDGHTVKTYDDLWTILKESDEDPDNSDNFILIYTGRSIPKSSVYPAFNREHVWAKSHGFPDESDYGYTDAHHLRPSDVDVNSARGNLDFDNGGTLVSGTSDCYSDADSWEPRDEVKGDIARMMFYMVVRYEGDGSTNDDYDLELVDYVGTSGVNFGKLSTLLEWHNNDPVNDIDRHRNEVVFSYQNNRNPFIDHPEYVAQIWGGDGVFISSVDHSPASPTSTDDVTVTATIISTSGNITTANLKWGTATGTYTDEVAMTNSGDTYSGIIPLQANGSTVFYIIEAEDDVAQSASSSEYNYTIEDNPSIVIFEEDFETIVANDPVTINGWSLYNNAGTKSWEGREFESNKYAQMSAYSTGESSIITWMVTPPIDLTDISSATLTFISKDAYNNGDPVEVFISTDYTGTGDPNSFTWSNLNPTLATGSTSGYATSFTESGEIDLTSYCGNTIYIAYKYVGGEPSVTTTMQIDDILITGFEAISGVPQITEITNTPLAPSDEDNVTISATITDDGTISTAEIKWGTESGSYPNSVSMTNSADVYSGDIPAQTSGTTVYYVIEATDNETGTNRSDENSYSVVFNELPQITNVSHLPLAPIEGDEVVIYATVTDADGTISLVEIKWGTAKGAFDNTVTMTYSGSDNIYNGTIASQTGGTSVSYVIEATDNDSESNRSDEYSFTYSQAVNQAPVISDVLINPESPTENDNVTISAAATDPDGSIESAILKWKIGEGSFNDISMNLSGGKYYGQIPKQAIGLTVYFTVLATDNKGLEGSIDDNYTVSQSSGIGDFNYEMDLLLYPNPVKEYLTIQLENYTGIVELNIYDVIGIPVVSQKLDFSNEHKIAINNLESGLYLVSFVIDNVLITKRIVVEK